MPDWEPKLCPGEGPHKLEAERLVSEAFDRFAEHEGQTKTQGEGEAPNSL